MNGNGPTITTERFLLRQIQKEDWRFYQQLTSNPEVMLYICDPLTEEQIHAGFESRLPLWTPDSQHWLCLVIVDKKNSMALGLTGFFPNQEKKTAELGFMIAPEFQNQGVGKETLAAVIHFALNQCQFTKVFASVTQGNQACVKLLNSLDFVLSNVTENAIEINGKRYDDLEFNLRSELSG